MYVDKTGLHHLFSAASVLNVASWKVTRPCRVEPHRRRNRWQADEDEVHECRECTTAGLAVLRPFSQRCGAAGDHRARLALG